MMLACAASLALGASLSASALDAREVVTSKNFYFSSQDLLTEEGYARVRENLHAAARSVCKPQNLMDAFDRRQASLCTERAYAQALQQLDVRVARARMNQREFALNQTSNAETSES